MSRQNPDVLLKAINDESENSTRGHLPRYFSVMQPELVKHMLCFRLLIQPKSKALTWFWDILNPMSDRRPRLLFRG